MADVGSWLDRIPGLSRLWGGVSGPGGVASRLAENTLQTESFAGITSGIRGFFYGIAEFFKVLLNTNWSEAMKDPSKIFSSAGERDKNGNNGTISKIGGEVLNLGMDDPTGTLTTVGVVGTGIYATKKIAGSVIGSLKESFTKNAAGIETNKGRLGRFKKLFQSGTNLLKKAGNAILGKLGSNKTLSLVGGGAIIGGGTILSSDEADASTIKDDSMLTATVDFGKNAVMTAVPVIGGAVSTYEAATDPNATTQDLVTEGGALTVGAVAGGLVGAFATAALATTTAPVWVTGLAVGTAGIAAYTAGDWAVRGISSYFNNSSEGRGLTTQKDIAVKSPQQIVGMEFTSP